MSSTPGSAELPPTLMLAAESLDRPETLRRTSDGRPLLLKFGNPADVAVTASSTDPGALVSQSRAMLENARRPF